MSRLGCSKLKSYLELIACSIQLQLRLLQIQSTKLTTKASRNRYLIETETNDRKSVFVQYTNLINLTSGSKAFPLRIRMISEILIRFLKNDRSTFSISTSFNSIYLPWCFVGLNLFVLFIYATPWYTLESMETRTFQQI